MRVDVFAFGDGSRSISDLRALFLDTKRTPIEASYVVVSSAGLMLAAADGTWTVIDGEALRFETPRQARCFGKACGLRFGWRAERLTNKKEEDDA